MSIGAPSTLGTLLIQRLDAVLGTTLGQQANLASGARPNAVAQPGNPENPHTLQNETQRHPREAVDKASARDQGRAAIGKATQAEVGALRAGRAGPHTGATPSAPTTLGFAARTILALLAEYPDSVQLTRGQAPLVAGQAAAQGGQGAQGAQGGVPTSSLATPAAAAPGSAIPQPVAGQTTNIFSTWASLATTLGEPGALPAQFAQSLVQTLQTSGLFYESHLANLAFGKTSLTALQQEPQGQIKPGGVPNQPANITAQDAGTSTTSSTTSTSATHTQGAAHATAQQAVIPGLDPQAQLLVRQQLEVLANQTFAWQGEAWPGAAMDWKVERHEQDGSHDGAVEHWATRLNLQLPVLGEVQARLTLAGDQLVMRLVAPQSADQLNEHIEDLRGRLLAQGLQASQLSVLDRDISNEPDAYEHTALQS